MVLELLGAALVCGCGTAVLGFSGKAEVSARPRCDCVGSVRELVIGVAGSCVAAEGADGAGCGIWVGAFGSGEVSGGWGLATAGSGCALGLGKPFQVPADLEV